MNKLKSKIKNTIEILKNKIIKPFKLFARKNGYFLIKDHYYSAIPTTDDLSQNYWEYKSDLVGIDINHENILNLLKLLDPYINEFRQSIPIYQSNNNSGGDNRTFLINSSFMAVDAHMYYSLIRYFKPKQIIEIGSGFSTLFANHALCQNAEKTKLTCIEPYPQSFLEELSSKNENILIIPKKLQDIDINFFSSLKADDILFIDSTHMLRTGSDVQIEYCEILPRLAPGVLIHVHDISLPKHYPSVYFDNELFWNEQYLLQAFLTFNSRFEIIWAGNYMMMNYPDLLISKFPEFLTMRQHFPMSEPTSFWIRVKD
jgi:predicted O-methyltransferase YrrM